MSITQAEAIAQTRARLDEPQSVYWTDDDLRMWINDIARDIARRTESLRATYDQAAVVGTSSYTPVWTSTTHPYRIYRIQFTPTGQTTTYPLEYVDYNTADSVWGLFQQQTQGIPAIWTSWGAPPTLNLQVYPSPSVAGTLRVFYYRLPTVLSTSDTSDQNTAVDLVDGWEDVLVDGVTYKAMMRDGDSMWQSQKQEYEMHLEAMMEATLRFTDAAGRVTTPSGGYIPEWLYGNADY